MKAKVLQLHRNPVSVQLSDLVVDIYILVVKHKTDNIKTRNLIGKLKLPRFINKHAQHFFASLSEQKRRELLPATQAKVLLRITFDPFLSDEITNIVPKILAAVGHEILRLGSPLFFRASSVIGRQR